ncbi:hypothetical protein [Glycomyces sp. MUSA5-2]|uniref:hypothetical protein n=1 Tax=Glycomyces sp. MUSA5-2 TaxID=2053002 RepID=UPI0030080E8F
MITEDNLLVEQGEGDYLSVRELTVAGSDREIGRDLASYARAHFGTRLARYADPVYGTARRAYLERNWPAFAERAEAFGLDADSDGFDPTGLGYDVPVPPGCSAVWVPPALTDTGRPLIGRNLDWYTMTFSAMLGREPASGEHGSYSRNVAIRFRPDGGRATLQIGSHDLLCPNIDGINEDGLFACILVGSTGRGDLGAAPAGGFDSGLSTNQVLGFILDRAATVAEAKLALLGQHVFTPMDNGEHWLIADAHGAATVFEIDADTRQYRFTDAGPDEVFIVANHTLHRYPDPGTFPKVDMDAEHNTFVRHLLLQRAIDTHTGPWTGEDVTALIDTVNCAFADNNKAGTANGWPERTLWTYLADPVERSLTARFYRRDGDPIPGTNHLQTFYTEPLTLQLKDTL